MIGLARVKVFIANLTYQIMYYFEYLFQINSYFLKLKKENYTARSS